MPADLTGATVELLQTLIRNECVNDGTPHSGHETKNADVLQSYQSRFPGDRAAINLARWQVFENENPDTFVGMYQFWVQKSQ